jgi:hypothetical protein
MNNTIKKIIVVAITFAFLLTAVGLSQAIAVNKAVSSEEKVVSETFTFYRYGPDGSVTPINVEVDVKNIDDVEEFLTEKCEELFEKDNEIQNFLESKINSFRENRIQNNLKYDFGYLRVKSKGIGLHYNTALLGQLMLRYILFRLGLPRPSSIFAKPVVFCRYAGDNSSQTTITPIIRTRLRIDAAKQINGSHSLLLISFVGITTWIGRFSITPFDVMPRRISGVATFAFWNKI